MSVAPKSPTAKNTGLRKQTPKTITLTKKKKVTKGWKDSKELTFSLCRLSPYPTGGFFAAALEAFGALAAPDAFAATSGSPVKPSLKALGMTKVPPDCFTLS